MNVKEMGQHVAYIAGATGFTGREVVRLLCEAGIRTFAHVRPDSNRLTEWTTRFSDYGAGVDTTEWSAVAMRECLSKIRPTLVFGLLGTTAKRARAAKKLGHDSTYETIDYGLTAMLIDAASQLEPAPRFIYLSSMGAQPGAKGAYIKARVRTEALLVKSTLPYTIARPSFIIGDRDEARLGENVGAKAIDGLLATLGVLGGKQLQQRYRSTTNTQLAAALVELACDSTAENTVVLSDQLQPSR